eukprot:9340254-Heterocapsa_arctica.AAC.1
MDLLEVRGRLFRSCSSSSSSSRSRSTTVRFSLFLTISPIALRPPTAIFKGSRCQHRTRDA